MVSNHGGGLTNMLFMPCGSSVFELRKKDDCLNNCFFALSSSLEIKYYYQTCDPVNNNEDVYTANIIVDVDLFRNNIEAMLGYSINPPVNTWDSEHYSWHVNTIS